MASEFEVYIVPLFSLPAPNLLLLQGPEQEELKICWSKLVKHVPKHQWPEANSDHHWPRRSRRWCSSRKKSNLEGFIARLQGFFEVK